MKIVFPILKKSTFLILFVIVVVLGYAIYQQISKSECRSKRIACHQEVVVFERIYHANRVALLNETLKNGKIHLVFDIQKSHYAPSQLFRYVDVQKLKEQIQRRFGEEETKSEVMLSVLLYENDPLDPGKKTQEAKLYAGYLVFGFHLHGELVYKIQIDFMDKEGKDIDKRVECVYRSLLSLH